MSKLIIQFILRFIAFFLIWYAIGYKRKDNEVFKLFSKDWLFLLIIVLIAGILLIELY